MIDSPQKLETRAVSFFQNQLEYLDDPVSKEIFFHLPEWSFVSDDHKEFPIPIESFPVVCPVLVNRREKQFVDVPFHVFVSLPNGNRTVWCPLLDRIFEIPEEGDAVPPIVEEIKRIIAREKLEENPKFIDRVLSVKETLGYVFQFSTILPEKEKDDDDIEIMNPYYPDELGMRKISISQEDELQGKIYGFEQEIELMTEAFDQPVPESILLLGPPGSGKTALWHKFVAEISGKDLFSHYWEADAVLLAGLENPRGKIENLGRWLIGKKMLFHLGNIWEIDQTGKSVDNNISLADILIPLITRGTLPAVVECTPEQYTELDRIHPSILAPFTVITMPTFEPARNMEILKAMNQTLTEGAISKAGLSRLESLLRRYSSYESIPGVAKSLMKQLSPLCETQEELGEHEVTRVFAEQSGLPLFLLDPDVELDIQATKEFFARRVIGQGGEDTESDTNEPGAIPVLLNLIEAIKVRVTKSDGPIASLLFIGPTGVGKTELAKSLAEFFYGSSQKMVRIDMNEYGQYGAADRLVNGVTGEGLPRFVLNRLGSFCSMSSKRPIPPFSICCYRCWAKVI